jgi:hypothetical protein
MTPTALGLLVIVSVGLIDGLEFLFPKTRLVHEVHNFPDVLGLSPEYAQTCGLWTGCALAAWSGVCCAGPLVLLAHPLLLLMGMATVPPLGVVLSLVILLLLILHVLLQQLREEPPIFEVHQASYALYGLLAVYLFGSATVQLLKSLFCAC